MYITTFYSFKGGVGRTMALVNTAVALALRGRRVLVVDFDIEAPGLDTFDVLRPQKDVPGLIDFVARYIKSGKAPNVSDYLGKCPEIGEEGGEIWIMPSGRNHIYTETLSQIDWMGLYERNEGYLLFEDIKEQWFNTVNPDYILIDSRTGHTDSSGICTRQLPDSVVILFFPNEQNLRGLTQVIQNIRAEEKNPRKKNIEIHFVMSNVPDLDDEDLILRDQIKAFKKQLGFHKEPMIVHRYDSLSLLNQVVFVKDRPRSRLAREYGQIVREISSRNWNDRDGALEYIKRVGGRRRWFEDDSISKREESLKKIEHAHQDDGEILFQLSEIKEADREFEISAQLINQAIQHGCARPEAFLKRSRYRANNRELDGAIEDAWYVLASEHISPPMIKEAIERITQKGEFKPKSLITSTAVTSLDLDGKCWLAETFNRSRDDLLIATALWEQIAASPDLQSGMKESARYGLGLSYMGLGRFEEAATCFRRLDSDILEMKINDAFNYAMAVWGIGGTIDRKVFERVIQLDQSDQGMEETANYLQCMAIAYWAAGESSEAVNYVNRAQRALFALRGRSEFSCWRYLQVSMDTFENDLNEIRSMIESHELRTPRFMTKPADPDDIAVSKPSKRVAGASRNLFDTYIIVDWSAQSRPSARNPEQDSIWWAVARTDGNRTPAAEPECKYNRTRHKARCDLESMISKELDDGRRVLVGFDFPFGYPEGVARRLTGKALALALWDWLDERIEDKSDNKNNRFEVASKINEKYPGAGPCWGRPGSWNFPKIPTQRPERTEQEHHPLEYRITDDRAKAKPVWQLFGRGSVGSQVLLGLPSLKRLIAHSDIAGRATVWPFETGLKVPDVTQGHAVFVEVYPSLLRKEIKERSCPEEIPDRAQVRITAQAFAALDADGGLAPLFQGPSDPPLDPDKRQLVETEEGWIFGLGHEKALKNSLEYMLSAP